MADSNEERASLVADGTLGLAELTRNRENVTHAEPQIEDRVARLEEMQSELQARMALQDKAREEANLHLNAIDKRLAVLESAGAIASTAPNETVKSLRKSEAHEVDSPQKPKAHEVESPQKPDAHEVESPQKPEAHEVESPQKPDAHEVESPQKPDAHEVESPQKPEAHEIVASKAEEEVKKSHESLEEPQFSSILKKKTSGMSIRAEGEDTPAEQLQQFGQKLNDPESTLSVEDVQQPEPEELEQDLQEIEPAREEEEDKRKVDFLIDEEEPDDLHSPSMKQSVEQEFSGYQLEGPHVPSDLPAEEEPEQKINQEIPNGEIGEQEAEQKPSERQSALGEEATQEQKPAELEQSDPQAVDAACGKVPCVAMCACGCGRPFPTTTGLTIFPCGCGFPCPESQADPTVVVKRTTRRSRGSGSKSRPSRISGNLRDSEPCTMSCTPTRQPASSDAEKNRGSGARTSVRRQPGADPYAHLLRKGYASPFADQGAPNLFVTALIPLGRQPPLSFAGQSRVTGDDFRCGSQCPSTMATAPAPFQQSAPPFGDPTQRQPSAGAPDPSSFPLQTRSGSMEHRGFADSAPPPPIYPQRDSPQSALQTPVLTRGVPGSAHLRVSQSVPFYPQGAFPTASPPPDIRSPAANVLNSSPPPSVSRSSVPSTFAPSYAPSPPLTPLSSSFARYPPSRTLAPGSASPSLPSFATASPQTHTSSTSFSSIRSPRKCPSVSCSVSSSPDRSPVSPIFLSGPPGVSTSVSDRPPMDTPYAAVPDQTPYAPSSADTRVKYQYGSTSFTSPTLSPPQYQTAGPSPDFTRFQVPPQGFYEGPVPPVPTRSGGPPYLGVSTDSPRMPCPAFRDKRPDKPRGGRYSGGSCVPSRPSRSSVSPCGSDPQGPSPVAPCAPRIPRHSRTGSCSSPSPCGGYPHPFTPPGQPAGADYPFDAQRAFLAVAGTPAMPIPAEQEASRSHPPKNVGAALPSGRPAVGTVTTYHAVMPDENYSVAYSYLTANSPSGSSTSARRMAQRNGLANEQDESAPTVSFNNVPSYNDLSSASRPPAADSGTPDARSPNGSQRPDLSNPGNRGSNESFSCSQDCPAVSGTAPCPSLSNISDQVPDRFDPPITTRCTHRSHVARPYSKCHSRTTRCTNAHIPVQCKDDAEARKAQGRCSARGRRQCP